MGQLVRADSAPALVEPVPILTVFADGLGDVRVSGDTVQLVYFAEQPIYCGTTPAPVERVVVAKVTLPRSSVEGARLVLTRALVVAALDEGALAVTAGHC